MLLSVKDIETTASDDLNKKILKGLNLNIKPGEVHVIMGPNGSGKSTLANTIFNSPRYIIDKGSIKLDGVELTEKSVDEIARLGVFMSFQTPEEIEGINLAQFLKSTKTAYSGEKQNIFSLNKQVDKLIEELDMKKEYTSRDFNVGFSGGEKKKNEILQMLLLNPKLAILDETDSGLDVDAIRVVSRGINMFKNDTNGVLIITHNTKILENIEVDFVHILVDGKIVHTGDYSLASKIEKDGYKDFIK